MTYIKYKLKDNKGGLSGVLAAIVISFMLFFISYTMLFSEPYFSDKRITREYVTLAKDMICGQPKKADLVQGYLNKKLTTLYGDGNFQVSYFVKRMNDNWEGATELTGDLSGYEYERGDLIVIYFERLNKSFFENAVKTEFSKAIAAEGMIEADTE